MTGFAPDTRLIASPNVVSADVGLETILLEVKSGTYFSLDRVGRKIWGQIVVAATVSQIQGALTSHFRVEADVAWSDLQRFCRELVAHGLVSAEPTVELQGAASESAPEESKHGNRDR